MSMQKGRLILTLLAVAHLSCEVPPLMSPGSSIFLQANPPFVAANGGVSVVTALLTEPAGTLVPDGTVVYFFASIGRIDSQGKTRDGVARVNFVSDSRSGDATITAFAGGAAPAPASGGSASTGSGSGSTAITIKVGNARPSLVLVTADPQRLRGPGAATVRANVFDASGNPVANVPVIFVITDFGEPAPPSPPATTLPGAPQESLDSGGAQVFTDNNGQAVDTLRTRAIAGVTASKTVKVTATTSNNISGTVDIAIN